MPAQRTLWEPPDEVDGFRIVRLIGAGAMGRVYLAHDNFLDRDAVVTTGASAETDEMCMAVGYFYPAQRPAFCINSLVVSQ